MGSRQLGFVRKAGLSALGLTLALALSTSADARHYGFRYHRHYARMTRHHAAPSESPAFAAMVVDAGSGRTLYARNEDELRHPASITKVMTLYLLFEKLDQGEIGLDTRIGVSEHAASMAPTKLGLRPGSTIPVEDAIKAIVTKSANDMAVAVAEAIGGDESDFAAMMTRKAHALGMSRTTYVNASGLPDDRQLTTARDLTVLGRSIRERFPRYYHYFSTPSFTYAGQYMPNHNHLMARITGMDGIKTGYTRASGFNLLSSVNRGSHHIVSVVLGGRSAAGRDAIMASLIEEHIEDAAPTRLAEAEQPSPVEAAAPTVRPAAYGRMAEDEPDGGPALIAPTLAVPQMPMQRPNDHARTVGHSDAAGSPIERPRPAFIAGAPRIDPSRPTAGDRTRFAEDGSTSDRPTHAGTPQAMATATPSSLRPPPRPQFIEASLATPAPAASSVKTAFLKTPIPVARPDALAGKPRAEESAVADAEPHGRGAWVIQIGATDAVDKATDLLNRAKTQSSNALASARPFTEKVRKGEATLYRARFAGLDTNEAEQACRSLKRSGFECFATKD